MAVSRSVVTTMTRCFMFPFFSELAWHTATDEKWTVRVECHGLIVAWKFRLSRHLRTLENDEKWCILFVFVCPYRVSLGTKGESTTIRCQDSSRMRSVCWHPTTFPNTHLTRISAPSMIRKWKLKFTVFFLMSKSCERRKTSLLKYDKCENLLVMLAVDIFYVKICCRAKWKTDDEIIEKIDSIRFFFGKTFWRALFSSFQIWNSRIILKLESPPHLPFTNETEISWLENEMGETREKRDNKIQKIRINVYGKKWFEFEMKILNLHTISITVNHHHPNKRKIFCKHSPMWLLSLSQSHLS